MSAKKPGETWTVQPPSVTDEGQETVLWPEWSDADVNAEKWDLPKGGKAQDKTKSTKGTSTPSVTTTSTLPPSNPQFEDEYQTALPSSIITLKEWKRPSDVYPETELVVYSEWKGQYPDLISENKHILHSELIRSIITSVCMLEYVGFAHPFDVEGESATFVPNTGGGSPWQPWHHIYSKCKAGKGQRHDPQVNDLGMYVVRLFWLGCWRKIVVDDRLPVDAKNHVLLPATASPSSVDETGSPEKELWPFLLSKAILKVASLTWTEGLEVADFDVISCLTGWTVQKVNTKGLDVFAIWEICTAYTDHFAWPPVEMDKKSKISETASKTSKIPKLPQSLATEPYFLVASCADLRESDEETVPDLSPCWSHPFLVDQTRDIPLLRPPPKPELALWKRYRWVDWAVRHGLWEPEEIPEPIKCFKMVSFLRKCSEHVVYKQDPSSQSLEIEHSVLVAEEMAQEKRAGKGDAGKRDKDKSSKSSKTSKKDGKGAEMTAPPDPSIWGDFFKLGSYVQEVRVYFKPSKFATNIKVSNVVAEVPKGGKKGGPEKKGKDKEEGARANLTYDHVLKPSRNEPLYLFCDSVDTKFLVLSLSHAGNRMSAWRPEEKREPQPEQAEVGGIWRRESLALRRLTMTKSSCILEESLLAKRPESCSESEESKQEEHVVEPTFDDRSQSHAMLVPFAWSTNRIAEPSVFINTFGAKTLLVELPPGRLCYRIYVKSCCSYVLNVFSDVHVVVERCEIVLDDMEKEAERMIALTFDVSSKYGYLVQNFGTPEFREALSDFYKCYCPKTILTKNDSMRVHSLMERELLSLLEDISSCEEYENFLYALKVLFVNPRLVPKMKSLQGVTAPHHGRPWKWSSLDIEEDDEMGKAIVNQLAEILQSFFRMVQVKKLLDTHSPTSKKFKGVFENLKSIYLQLFSIPKRSEMGPLLLRNVLFDEDFQTVAPRYECFEDIKSVVRVEKFSGVEKDVGRNVWVPLLRYVFLCKQSVLIRIELFCPLPLYMVRVFDNDTEREIERHTNNVTVFKYRYNDKGYTILGYGWTADQAVPEIPWNLKLITLKHKLASPIEIRSSPTAELHISGYYRPNVNNLICKCLVTIKQKGLFTFRVSVTYGHARINFRCLAESGAPIREISGTENVIVPLITLHCGPDATPPPTPAGSKTIKKRRASQSNSSVRRAQSDKNSLADSKKSSSVKSELVAATYVLEAYVLDDSWPLTKPEWDTVQKVRELDHVGPEFCRSSANAETRRGSDSGRRPSRSKASLVPDHGPSPKWLVQVLHDVGEEVTIECDRRRDEEIKEIKRKWFQAEQGRYEKAVKIREKFLEENCPRAAVSSSPSLERDSKQQSKETVELLILSGRIKFDDSVTAASPSSQSATVLSASWKNLEELPRTSKPPMSLSKMLPELNFTDYAPKDYVRREGSERILTDDDREQLLEERSKEMKQFEEYQAAQVIRTQDQVKELLEREKILDKWYEGVRQESKRKIASAYEAKKNYFVELIEEKKRKAKEEKAKKDAAAEPKKKK